MMLLFGDRDIRETTLLSIDNNLLVKAIKHETPTYVEIQVPREKLRYICSYYFLIKIQ